MKAKTETYQGTVTRVFFANSESPFMAGVLTLENGTEIRFGGKCFADVGDQLEIVGSWGKHPKFGPQVEVESGIVRMDESPNGLIHLLATHAAFEGLGPFRARKVVDTALALSSDGNAATALIAHPNEIAMRANVPLEIVQNAAKVWGECKGYFDALAQLAEQGWGVAQSSKIVTKFGENAAAIVRQDPYMLIGKIPRFGFKTVDAIARKLGTLSTDPARLQAGVAYCLDKIAEDGNTWTTRDGLKEQASAELRPDTLEGEDKIDDAIDELIAQGAIYVDQTPVGKSLVADARLALTEIEVFRWLVSGMGNSDVEPFSLNGPRAKAISATLNTGQAAAMRGFSSSLVAVISGGAGVGKTYTMRAICEVAEENGLTVALCAPTGKAARRLAHATSREARTIHRTLCPIFDHERGEFVFSRNAGNPIEANLVVVDEVSMVDIRLMRSLLSALPSDCRLLLVGDHHQIPSVGPGAILRDLLSARSLYPNSVHVLTEIVRQAGILARNTTALLDGLVVTQEAPPWGIYSTEKGSESGTAAFISSIVESLVTAPEPLEPFRRYLDPAWDIQVLAPMRKGPIGTYALNVHLQRLRQRMLGNPAPDATPDGKTPKPLVGDRIIWIRNDYELDLLNGTQAIVLAFPKGGSMLIHTEDGREVMIPAAKRALVEVAYAMTIHKSQGSEWPCVILVCSSSHWIMHDRNLLYTGASRAAESLTIVGDIAGVKHFAATRKSARRQTFGGFAVHGWEPKTGFATELGQRNLCAENDIAESIVSTEF